MPALVETIGVDLSNYVQAARGPVTPQAPPSSNLEPGYNVYLRCPLPPIWSATPDSLRQFYQNSVVPQTRLFSPSNALATSGNSTTNVFVSSGSSSGGSGGGGTTTNLVVNQFSIRTPVLSPNAKFIGSIQLSKVFQLLGVTVSSPSRVELYGTASSQSADLSRGLDVPLPAGSFQNVIFDIAIDTSPYSWSFQDRVGANADSPVTSRAYLTVTNIGSASTAITISMSYVPIVQ